MASDAASCTSRSGTPASRAAVMKECRRLWGPIRFGGAGCLGDPAHHAGYGVAGEPVAVDSDEGRVLEAIADGQIEGSGGPRCEGDGDGLAALAVHDQGPGASFEAELFDVDAERLGDP